MLKLLFLLSLFSQDHVDAQLRVGNTAAAVKEARAVFSQTQESYELLLKSLAAAGHDQEMVGVWEDFYAHYPKSAMEQEVLEQMCWGILRKSRKAPGLSAQLIGIIAAALTQDMYAVPLLLEGLSHPNAHIRAVSVELGSLFGDHPLREKIRALLTTEQVSEVRLTVIKAVAKLRQEEAMPILLARVADPKVGAREKKVAIEALVNFHETVSHTELMHLVTHKRAGLRELACAVIAHCELREEVASLHRLAGDPQPDVQVAALKALGYLRVAPTDQIKWLAKRARLSRVGIAASFVWQLAEPEAAPLKMWLEHKEVEVRNVAASAVAAAGPYGVEMARAYLEKMDDPYVQANLALALIGQREECEKACEILDQLLKTHDEKWMFAEEGLFKTLKKSTVQHNPAIPNYPEVVNQTVRLEMLNLLAILDYPGAQEAIKAFLAKRRWGITGLAAETLLGEGDETAIEHVRALLDDPDAHIRAEAALVLATWGKDASALPHLINVYPEADRQLQIKILESLGRIGDRQAIPFLLERLKEPSLMLRMIAASILLQTLNA